MRVLVIGGGGREHAIIDALSKSPRVTALFCSPGNGGTALQANNVSIELSDPAFIAEWAEVNAIDLVVIGPEDLLVIGVSDMCLASGIPCFGPKAAGAYIEGSKSFAKELMARYDIPTAACCVFDSREDAMVYLDTVKIPVVVKADGLAAGKGVVVADTLIDARGAVTECFEGRYGEAGERVVIEEFLEGPECSLLAFTDGKTMLPMVPAQDYKRAYDNDEGPNTGGMGVYTPVPAVDDATLAEMTRILERTVAAFATEDIDYRGVLYGGFILTEDGPKVLEYNARFGDPETQVILPRLKTDIADVFMATIEQRLDEITLEWSDDAAVSVVLAAGGYPGGYEKGKVIRGIDQAEQVEGVRVYHAGTALAKDLTVFTNGGRVLNVTALAPTLAEARSRAYEAVDRISFADMNYRTDIGLKALRAPGEA
ncbi:MAG: phosphoribosylamine--glycine ligase [Coriobacteriia bacterium]|nr:phosphoribosylamine--glycine ligase [Coriobacteriia bacterium]